MEEPDVTCELCNRKHVYPPKVTQWQHVLRAEMPAWVKEICFDRGDGVLECEMSAGWRTVVHGQWVAQVFGGIVVSDHPVVIGYRVDGNGCPVPGEGRP